MLKKWMTINGHESAEPQDILTVAFDRSAKPQEEEEKCQRQWLFGEDATTLYMDRLRFGYFVSIGQHQSLLSPSQSLDHSLFNFPFSSFAKNFETVWSGCPSLKTNQFNWFLPCYYFPINRTLSVRLNFNTFERLRFYRLYVTEIVT